MQQQPWDFDPPQVGDANQDMTFRSIGAALSQWEYFEGNLSLCFSYLIGSGYGNMAALRSYGSVESFRGRAFMIRTAAEVYFKTTANDRLHADLTSLLNLASNHLSGKRNEIAHGIVNPYYKIVDGGSCHEGFVLYPAYYATRKLKLADVLPLTAEPNYVYSSVEIDKIATFFQQLADKAIDILTHLTGLEQLRSR